MSEKINSLEIACLLKQIFWGRSLVPNLSLDYQKNMKYNSYKQVLSSLTTVLYGQHRNSFSFDSCPKILHVPEFFAHSHGPYFLNIPFNFGKNPSVFKKNPQVAFLRLSFPVLEFLNFIWRSVSHNQFLL